MPEAQRRFPVMNRTRGAYGDPLPDCPASVPWDVVALHEQQALKNHYQTVQRLAERGGLSPCELAAVLEDRAWRPMPVAEAVALVLNALEPNGDSGE